ncbi:hypothetical protein RRG08_064728 [Elysia crispata]|uniref:Uncharacterized protein n=1 Tax=Elysia crispata TaxID=231223 RepID=A0AAE0YZP6_9GAST|nr:hypothetical protein RRG08_064728 [Elysia crispata]
MSATGFPPTAPTQAKQARVASHARSSPLLSPAPAAANDIRSATRNLWLTGSDNISSQTSVPATTLRQWRDFSPSLNKRVSGKSESSSLESSSAEFDGDISIVAPLGQEENTDLYSIKSFPISVSTASKDNQQTFPDTASDSNSTYVIDKQKPLRLELLNLTNSSSSEESLLTGLLPSATFSNDSKIHNHPTF